MKPTRSPLRASLSISFAALIAAGCSARPSTERVGHGGRALTTVTNFGSNPGNLTMYVHAPVAVTAPAPLVVVLHGCTQSAASLDSRAQWSKLGDDLSFYTAFAEAPSAWCFGWYDSNQTARGQGEVESIKQMVDKMKADYSIDASRVYIMGFSAGGFMAASVMAAYPDVFVAGSIMSGGPTGCAQLANPTGCTSGINRTAAEWGASVRDAFPGYGGAYPRLSIFHGSSDTIVDVSNERELVDQWSNVYGINATADVSEMVKGHEHKVYKDAAGNAILETYRISGMAHAISVDPGTAPDQGGTEGAYAEAHDLYAPYYAAKFWGLVSSGAGGSGAGGAGGSLSGASGSAGEGGGSGHCGTAGSAGAGGGT